MKAIVSNLRDEVFQKHSDKRFLLCLKCGGEYSAHSGDYWNLPNDYQFKCCNKEIVIAIRQVITNVL